MVEVKILYREPAVLLGALAAVFQLVIAFGVDVTPELQAILTAVVVAAFGLYTAVKVGDGLHAALLTLLQAGMSLFAYYGLDWSGDKQATVLGAISVLLGLWIRDRVTAPVGPEVSPPGKLVVADTATAVPR